MRLNPIIFLSSFLFVSSAVAQAEIPFNSPQNSIEYKASGNSYTWQPVTGETPKPAQPYRPDFSKGSVSTVQPKASWAPQLPYAHKGGAAAKMSFSAMASKAAVASAAAKQFAKGAASCGVKPGHPLAVSASMAGCLGGPLLVAAAIDWGWHQISSDDSGVISASVPDTGAFTSTGSRFEASGSFGYTAEAACQAAAAVAGFTFHSVDGNRCNISRSSGPEYLTRIYVRTDPTCASGNIIGSDGVCYPAGQTPTINEPIESYLDSKFNTLPWGTAHANLMAGVMSAGYGVFTDGTSGLIDGPNKVPLGTVVSTWPVSVISGTTEVASPSYSGATDPGTQTTTTTTTANNSYAGNQQTTNTGTHSTTTVTNNITNVTNITNESTSEKDESPEEIATDSPLAPIPELYKQKYPDGLTGVFNDFKSRINTTSFVQLIGALTPNISGAGTCPSWTIDLTWTPGGSMGRHTIGPDICWIWPILKIIVMVTTLFTVRRLIFGG